MASQLPENISLRRRAGAHAPVEGRLAAGRLARLAQLAISTAPEDRALGEDETSSTDRRHEAPSREPISARAASAVRPVEVRLTLIADSAGLATLRGELRTEVTLICQRCLEPLEVPLAVEVDVLAIDAGDANGRERALAAEREIVEVEGETLNLAEFVEEEILLSLPDYPMHPADAVPGCQPETGASSQEDAAPRTRPFAGLDALLAASGEPQSRN